MLSWETQALEEEANCTEAEVRLCFFEATSHGKAGRTGIAVGWKTKHIRRFFRTRSLALRRAWWPLASQIRFRRGCCSSPMQCDGPSAGKGVRGNKLSDSHAMCLWSWTWWGIAVVVLLVHTVSSTETEMRNR
jgi:hypothetical protein